MTFASFWRVSLSLPTPIWLRPIPRTSWAIAVASSRAASMLPSTDSPCVRLRTRWLRRSMMSSSTLIVLAATASSEGRLTSLPVASCTWV